MALVLVMFLEAHIAYLQIAESKTVNVLVWLANNTDINGNLHYTLEEVAGNCDVTKLTVTRTFQKLYKKGFLTKVRNGHYILKQIS